MYDLNVWSSIILQKPTVIQLIKILPEETSGSHGGEYEDDCLPGCCAM
jgi:hypothetical protein